MLAPVVALENGEHLGKFLEESRILVVDCHQNWCGPCETVRPTYNSLMSEIDDCEQRVAFLTANLSELAPAIDDLVKETEIDLSNHGCMPFFLVIKVRSLKEKIS